MELEQCKRKFAEFQQNINSRVMADVRENVNGIDALMKNKAEMFKDLSRQTAGGALVSTSHGAGTTTINIGRLTIQNIPSFAGLTSGHSTGLASVGGGGTGDYGYQAKLQIEL